MNILLTEPEPITNENAILRKTPPAQGLIAVEPQARILYVDDEPVTRKLGELVLARSGYVVDAAADGVEAWAALHDRKYDLLITDCQMPRLTGLELIRKVRLASIRVPIILASSIVSTSPIEDLPWLECGAMLAKPFTAEKLVSVVRDVLRTGAIGTETSTGGLPTAERFHVRVQPHRAWGINE